MTYFAEQDRWHDLAELAKLEGEPVITDAESGWPEGVIAALEEHSFPDTE